MSERLRYIEVGNVIGVTGRIGGDSDISIDPLHAFFYMSNT